MPVRLPVLALLAAMLASPAPVAATIFPASVDDLCAPDADPCTIEDDVDVSDGPAVLDFGVRDVVFAPGKQLRVGFGSLEIHCGGFRIGRENEVAILLHAYAAPDALLGGSLAIFAYETCSDEPARRCLVDADCTAGICTGPTPGFQHLTIVGGVAGDAAAAGTLELRSAAGIHLRSEISLEGIGDGASGGEVVVAAGRAPSWVQGRISVKAPYGGSVSLASATSADIDAGIDVGGKWSAGDIAISAGGELEVNGRLDANALSASGVSGGTVTIVSTGDIAVARGSFFGGGLGDVKPRLLVNARGAIQDGQGGSIAVASTGGSVDAGADLRMVANGGRNAFSNGGTIALQGAGGVSFEGRATATGGRFGGTFEASSGDALELGAGARIDVSGGLSGGIAEIAATGDVDASSSIRARARDKAAGETGAVSFDGANVRAAGKISVSGLAGAEPALRIGGCDVEIADGAKFSLLTPGAALRTQTRERLTVAAGASVKAPAAAVHTFEYRDGGPVPVVSGKVTPAPNLVASALAACPGP